MSIVTRKSAREIDLMRHAGAIVAEVLALVESELRPGVTTAHLDELADRARVLRAPARPGIVISGCRSSHRSLPSR